MIELLLEAERELAVGMLDRAERLYRQAADHDPHNAIALVGLARVALERGDDAAAADLGGRALEIDPDNVAAQRLVDRLASASGERGERRERGELREPAVPPAPTPEPAPTPAPAPVPLPEPTRRSGGILARMRRWFGRR